MNEYNVQLIVTSNLSVANNDVYVEDKSFPMYTFLTPVIFEPTYFDK